MGTIYGCEVGQGQVGRNYGVNVVKLYKEDKIMEYALNAFRQFEQSFPTWKSEIAGDMVLAPLVDKLWAQITAVCGTLGEAKETIGQALERMVEVDVAEVEREREKT